MSAPLSPRRLPLEPRRLLLGGRAGRPAPLGVDRRLRHLVPRAARERLGGRRDPAPALGAGGDRPARPPAAPPPRRALEPAAGPPRPPRDARFRPRRPPAPAQHPQPDRV